MNDSVLVSIICIAYNHEKYIKQTLESFVNQKTSFRYEVLVHDDASTDNTADIIREMAALYPDVIFPILQTENQYSKNRLVTNNIVLPKAKGKYIALCEGDDYWTDPDKLQIQVDWLEAHPDYSACVHNTSVLNCKSGAQRLINSQHAGDRDISFETVLYGVAKAYHTSSVVARKDVFSVLPDFYYASMKWGVGDWPRAIWYLLNGKVRFIDKIMSVYREFSGDNSWTHNSLGRQMTNRAVTSTLEMYRELLGHVSGEYAAMVKEAILKYEWELLQIEGEYARMKKAPYDVLYKNAPLTQRLWISFKQYFPGLYCAYLKLQGRKAEIPEKFIK